MKRKNIFSVATIGLLSLLLVVGAAVAAVFPEDNTFTGTVNSFEKGIKIGKQGTGGVTFFNGTIVNATTTDGANNPVTFGDNVRIDGRIQRGHNGAGDTWNVIVDDGLEVNKTLMVTGESTMKGKVKFEGGVEGIPMVDAYTKTETNNLLTPKSNTADVYNKVSSDSRYYTQTQVDNGFIPSNQSRSLVIPGNAFNLMVGGINFVKDTNIGGGIYATAAPTWFTVPFNLPHGSKIHQFHISYIDNSAGGDMTVAMNNHDAASDTGVTMSSLTSSGFTGAFATASSPYWATPFVVDTASKSYTLELTLPVANPLFKLVNVKIDYKTQ